MGVKSNKLVQWPIIVIKVSDTTYLKHISFDRSLKFDKVGFGQTTQKHVEPFWGTLIITETENHN